MKTYINILSALLIVFAVLFALAGALIGITVTETNIILSFAYIGGGLFWCILILSIDVILRQQRDQTDYQRDQLDNQQKWFQYLSDKLDELQKK